MANKVDVTVIIPAYNEEGNILSALSGVENQLKKHAGDYEIIVVSDGSTDKTVKQVQKYMQGRKKIRLINRVVNKGLAYTFMEGVRSAAMNYVTSFHGDCDASPVFLKELLEHAAHADLIGTYPISTQNRPLFRRAISKAYILCLNALFRQHVRYYNGVFLCKTSLLKNIDIKSKGFTIYSEAKIKLMKEGYDLYEIPYMQTGRAYGYSKAVRLQNAIQTIEILVHLIAISYLK